MDNLELKKKQKLDRKNRQRRIEYALKAGKLSQRAIAEREGISHTTVYRIAKTLKICA